MEHFDEIKRDELDQTREYFAAKGAFSLKEVNERLGFKYGSKNGDVRMIASGMFKDISKFMRSEEGDWGADVMAETGLPGTKVVVDGVTIYFHGISHSQGNSVDKGVGKEEFDNFFKKWVHDTYFDKKEGVVLESGFKAAYGMTWGTTAGEDSVMNRLYKENYAKSVIDLSTALLLSGFMSFIRRNESYSAALPEFIGREINARKSMKDLIEMRKTFFKLPQPFLTLLFEGLGRSHIVEKSIVLFRQGMDQVRGETVVHFLCGLNHEASMAALAKQEGTHGAGRKAYTKAELELEGKDLLRKMAITTT